MKQSTTEDKEGDNSSDQNKEIRSLIQRGKPFFSNTCQSGLKQVLAMFGEWHFFKTRQQIPNTVFYGW